MNFDQLKTAWQTSLATPPEASELRRMSHEAHASALRYQRGALLRRIYGTAVFVLVLAMLAVLITMPGPAIWPGMRVALALWSASLIICTVGLWRLRRTRRSRPDASLTNHLKAALADIQREMAYYRTLRWTFWLPFGLGFLAALLWQPPTPPGSHPILLIGGAVFWVWGLIYAPRRWLRRFEPQVMQLQGMLRETRNDTETTGDD